MANHQLAAVIAGRVATAGAKEAINGVADFIRPASPSARLSSARLAAVTSARPRAGALAAVVAVILFGSACGQPAPAERITGDPRAGLSIFKNEGCYACHAVAGVAVGDAGPALDGEGTRRGEAAVRAMLPAHLRAVHAMPLSRGDLGDLAAYLAGLR